MYSTMSISKKLMYSENLVTEISRNFEFVYIYNKCWDILFDYEVI